jgi:DNA-binding NarL/FixJ family response regulator
MGTKLSPSSKAGKPQKTSGHSLPLTAREAEILDAARNAATIAEAAQKLKISRQFRTFAMA